MVAMTVSVSFRTYLLEQLGQIRPVTTRPMFGGLTFFADGRAFALVAEETLYFKVDDSNRSDFVAAGMGPFLPFGDPERPMQYYQLPEEVLEDPDQLAEWMAKAIAVAARANTKSKAKAPGRPAAKRK
ncbi:TfoX/Sxy family protein [Geothrix sp. PMB-07]|uniref:TfoX/Sxy family protein n=1 Tax=Geothrix sp. PMB-07 TaxID=3068640 RepID=UPI0027429839|nr:TfoX/Sxy family protein [Geothrix sp. PMB-07]WLT29982.1 TfoX/Sxy family protein [Geothrix sp. PMB-07]